MKPDRLRTLTGQIPDHTSTPGADEPSEATGGGLVARVKEFTIYHVNAIVVVLVVIVVFAGSRMIMATGHEVPTPEETPIVVEGTTPTPATVIVHVAGAVNAPGVVELPESSRVVDAIDKAGGLADDADVGTLNLAAKLVDGAQIIVGRIGEPPPATQPGGVSSESGSSLVNLNLASAAELEALPGVGPVTAAAIVSFRDANGGFQSVEQLQEVDGIGPKTFATLQPLVSV